MTKEKDKKNSKKTQNRYTEISKKQQKYFWDIITNSIYRLLLSIILVIVSLVLFVILGNFIQGINNWVLSIAFLIVFTALVFFPLKYACINYVQITSEIELNYAINQLRRCIFSLVTKEERDKRNYRSLQVWINELRLDIVFYLNKSAFVSPPITNFELVRLKKKMDVFFNCSSEVLVPLDKLFSHADEINADYWATCSPEEDLVEDEEAISELKYQRMEKTGQFDEFGLTEMDDFLIHLLDVLFDKEIKPYSWRTFKHPVNILLISKFFNVWNQKISNCTNCKQSFDKATNDIDEYYKSVDQLESEKRQRKWQLMDDTKIILFSVVLSTIIQYLINIR